MVLLPVPWWTTNDPRTIRAWPASVEPARLRVSSPAPRDMVTARSNVVAPAVPGVASRLTVAVPAPAVRFSVPANRVSSIVTAFVPAPRLNRAAPPTWALNRVSESLPAPSVTVRFRPTASPAELNVFPAWTVVAPAPVTVRLPRTIVGWAVLNPSNPTAAVPVPRPQVAFPRTSTSNSPLVAPSPLPSTSVTDTFPRI